MPVDYFFGSVYILQTDLGSILNNPTIIVGLGVLVLLVGGGFYLLNQKKPDALDPLKDQGKLIQSKATKIGEVALDKIDDVLEQYQKVLPYLKELGLKVEGLSIEAGLFPKIKTSLIASLSAIEVGAVERVKEQNKSNQLLVAILNAVLLAKKCNDRLDQASISLFKDMIVDIELGIPPAISVRFK